MINLLPPNDIEHYSYARRNAHLRKWIIAAIAGLVGVLIITFGGLLTMENTINNYNHRLARSSGPATEKQLDQLQEQSTTISNNVRLAVQVLSQEVLFSQLLRRIAAVTPHNAKLTQLSIGNVQGGIDISGSATDYTTATQLQVNLQAPTNQIFSKADIQSIACSPNQDDPAYPCTVTIRALFAKNNPYLFINKGQTP